MADKPRHVAIAEYAAWLLRCLPVDGLTDPKRADWQDRLDRLAESERVAREMYERQSSAVRAVTS